MSDIKDFEFSKVDGGYSIIEYTGSDVNVVLPESFEGEPVVELGQAFRHNKKLVTVKLPNSLLKITKHAFERCQSLIEIEIPNSVTELASDTFLSCSSLSKASLPNGLKVLPSSFFANCELLESCKLPDSLEMIDGFAFYSCYKLEEIIIPHTVTKIDTRAFAYCKSLKRFVCNHSDIKIHKETFLASMNTESKLEELPLNIWSKVDLSYDQNSVLIKVVATKFETFTEQEKKECLSFLKRKKKMKEQLFVRGDAEIINFYLSTGTKLTLDELDKYLKENIKAEHTEATAILLEYKEKNFSNEQKEQFEENKELVEIGLELPTLKQFKEKWTCSKVDDGLRVSGYKGEWTDIATIPKMIADGTKITGIKNSKDGGFRGMKKLVIEADINEIPNKAFKYTGKLEEIILPDTIENIPRTAFLNCNDLKEIVLPQKVKSIGYEAFCHCEKLEKVVCNELLEEIDTIAFAHCSSLKDINLPESLKKIGEQAFLKCKSLEKIVIPSGVLKIDSLTFWGCENLKEVIVSKDTKIDDKAFLDCPLVKVIMK